MPSENVGTGVGDAAVKLMLTETWYKLAWLTQILPALDTYASDGFVTYDVPPEKEVPASAHAPLPAASVPLPVYITTDGLALAESGSSATATRNIIGLRSCMVVTRLVVRVACVCRRMDHTTTAATGSDARWRSRQAHPLMR